MDKQAVTQRAKQGDSEPLLSPPGFLCSILRSAWPLQILTRGDVRSVSVILESRFSSSRETCVGVGVCVSRLLGRSLSPLGVGPLGVVFPDRPPPLGLHDLVRATSIYPCQVVHTYLKLLTHTKRRTLAVHQPHNSQAFRVGIFMTPVGQKDTVSSTGSPCLPFCTLSNLLLSPFLFCPQVVLSWSLTLS